MTETNSQVEAEKPLVFVVDDESTISSTLAVILSRAGFDARAFTDPVEALHAAEEKCPEILISDVVMPKLNGIDLGLQFKAIYPNCRILLFSGQAATSDMLKTARALGHHFNLLTKPVHPRDLLAAIKTMK